MPYGDSNWPPPDPDDENGDDLPFINALLTWSWACRGVRKPWSVATSFAIATAKLYILAAHRPLADSELLELERLFAAAIRRMNRYTIGPVPKQTP